MKQIKQIIVLILISHFSVLYAEISESQRWAIALTGIMTEVNEDSFSTLNSNELNEDNKKNYSITLSRDWGIENRKDLLETLDDMEKDGHSQELMLCQKIINECNQNKIEINIFNMINKYNLTSKQYNYLKFTLANWQIFGNRNIIVWDLGRNIALCRWGYDCGYLSEKEAWAKIMYYAKKIQPMYTSWEDYGFDYYMGRVFWASGFGADVDYLVNTDPIYRKLISSSGQWKNLIWDQRLDE